MVVLFSSRNIFYIIFLLQKETWQVIFTEAVTERTASLNTGHLEDVHTWTNKLVGFYVTAVIITNELRLQYIFVKIAQLLHPFFEPNDSSLSLRNVLIHKK